MVTLSFDENHVSLSTNNVSAFLGKGVPYLAIKTFFSDTNLVTFTTNIEENSKGEWFEVVEDAHGPGLQLDTNQIFCGHVVTNGAVSVPENFVVRKHYSGVRLAQLHCFRI